MSGKRIVKEPTPVYRFQTTDRERLDRFDHIWFKVSDGAHAGKWKCCLCGGIAANPLPYPTRNDWIPPEHEELTQEERDLVPYEG